MAKRKKIDLDTKKRSAADRYEIMPYTTDMTSETMTLGDKQYAWGRQGAVHVKDGVEAQALQDKYGDRVITMKVSSPDVHDRGHRYFFSMPEPAYKMFERWRKAEVATVTPEEYWKMCNSADFYDRNSYVFPNMPDFLDGEVGYDDFSNKRIVVRRVNDGKTEGEEEEGTAGHAPDAERAHDEGFGDAHDEAQEAFERRSKEEQEEGRETHARILRE